MVSFIHYLLVLPVRHTVERHNVVTCLLLQKDYDTPFAAQINSSTISTQSNDFLQPVTALVPRSSKCFL